MHINPNPCKYIYANLPVAWFLKSRLRYFGVDFAKNFKYIYINKYMTSILKEYLP